MTDLSPAAQAVMKAAEDAYESNFSEFHCCADRVAAAALEALADQVVPAEIDLPPIAPDLGHFRQHERRLTRQRILAIAAELRQ